MKLARIALGLVVPLVAVSAAPASGQAPAPVAPSAAPTSQWRTVDRASDIDGDGRADVVRLRRRSDQVCRIRVRTATGHRDTRSVRTDLNPCRWHGAARFDRRRGEEVSVVTALGAHAAFHTVLTWRAGHLRVERPPAGAHWTVDAAAMSSTGIRRRHNARGALRVVVVSVSDRGRRWAGHRRVLAFRHGAWRQLSDHRIRVRPRTARRVAGWHVRGLPRWA